MRAWWGDAGSPVAALHHALVVANRSACNFARQVGQAPGAHGRKRRRPRAPSGWVGQLLASLLRVPDPYVHQQSSPL